MGTSALSSRCILTPLLFYLPASFTIYQVLYADPKEETPEGEVADAREKATRELPVMEYPQTNTCVFPPLGWQEDREKLLKRSGTVPSQV